MQFYEHNLLGNDKTGEYYNKNGHRCLDIENINLRKYILFAGDNFGLGLDKKIEDTFPYIIAKKSNLDYYNLCLFNGGMDGMKYNIITWMKVFEKHPPKAIIIANEFLNSLLVSDNNFTNLKPGNLEDPSIIELLHAGNLCGYFLGKHLLFSTLFNHFLTVPTFQLLPVNRETVKCDSIVNIKYEENKFDHNQVADIFIKLLAERTERVAP